ncbi:MAG: S41 family peptidase [Phycisphaerae bacterium]|nr:S41 family peptidase [Phycisphaerae bacterium]
MKIINPISVNLKKDSGPVVDIGLFLQVITGLCFVLTLWIYQSPGSLMAGNLYTAEISHLLQEAQSAVDQKQWDEAKHCFQKAFDKADSPKKDTIKAKLQWCTANSMLNRRYKDGSVSEHVRKIEPGQAGEILNETWQLINRSFYRSVDMNALMSQALWQLQALTENPEIYRQYPVKVEKMERLKEKIITLRHTLSQESDTDDTAIKTMVVSLCNLSNEAGLGKSWPCIELAYALADSLGKYSYLLSPKQYVSLCAQLEGAYVGIGVDLIFQTDFPLVYDVVPGSPADHGGLLPGDIIISIDERSILSKSSEIVSQLLTGPQQSYVKLTVKRQKGAGVSEIKSFSLKRQSISSSTVRYVRLIPKTKIGFLRVASFGYNTAWEMRQSIDKLLQKGAESLIIDLRNNGGGVLTSAVDAVRLFINSGTIVTINSGSEIKKYKAGGDNFYSYDLPLVILVDENTASAAEIFSAALKDNKRATIIGEKTFGKAVVQSIYKINSANTALCITTATYLPPSNIGFNHIGIIPDITIKKGIKSSFKPFSVLNYISVDDDAMQKGMQLLTGDKSS